MAEQWRLALAWLTLLLCALFEALALYTVLGAIRHRKNLHIQKV